MEDPKLFDPNKAQFPAAPAQDVAVEPEETVEESPQAAESIAQAQPEAPKPETEEQKNFKSLRDAWRTAERERDELARKLQQMEAAPKQEEEDDILLGPDEIAEGKHLAKVSKKLKATEAKLKQMQEDIGKQQQQSAAMIAEATIKASHPDFDTVVNEDNIKTLMTNYPDIAASLQANPNFVSKAKAAYTMIKQLGIVKDTTYSPDRDRAIRNAAKPRPVASVSPQQGNSPLAQANAFAEGLTDDLKAQYLKEMNESRKSY